MPAPTQYIETPEALSAAVAACMSADVLAIDTEFARFNTYYPIVGLIQIFDGTNCYLIDPLPLETLSPLASLMTNPDIVKVFHSGSEDMEVFQRCLGTVPTNLFDSQVAAAALGTGFSMSYQAIVGHYLGIELAKEETRSDWLQRPLTEGQLAYAALDVIYLLQVYQKQLDALQDLERLEWVTEESARLRDDLPIMVDPKQTYLKAKGIAGMKQDQLSVLRELYAWREQIARDTDVPRNRVIDQKAVYAIAKADVRDKNDLHRVDELTPRQIRKYGDDLLFEVTRAKQLSSDAMPAVIKADRKPIDNKRVKTLRAIVEAEAEKHAIAPELLCKRRDLEQLLRSGDSSDGYQLPASLQGWRQPIVGTKLLEFLNS